MSILKIKFLVPILSSEDKQSTLIPTDALQSITDVYAGGLFVYLAFLDTQWKNDLCISEEHLMKHLKMSKNKFNKSLKYLVDNKLISYISDKDI